MIWEKVKELEEKLDQLNKQIREIEEELESLPSGHIDSKKVKGKQYYYLRYWEEGKLKSKYLGKDPSEERAKLDKALKLRQQLTSLKEEKVRIERVMQKIQSALFSIVF
ncbi:DUF342 domain-containing protein [Sulfuracidifex tepidarius]|uniref:DUF6788 domain-containing protein n=1 Tax=Sulfuracidifex tepidarius TaxID=1294262 RepID=A0A510DRB8_9CREN|nr:DUF342 domain-containing protein [Sulfuracidifex tepidarius]BBG22718.1 hypothetical protein IC006_0002 [Sulfuracidifex tepidarius]BBG25497.1 hypothetical protein IC007_0002 [Sulfuracidifex tepidarius]